ncbi:hypothetical protein DPMN_194073 [Dreissena polymorpha]|uniref:Uncharacterized protein n=1 Tax=Dreissena polymorpha TaxID=45954 RepID=A0A9D3Y383_DREPO|nr:hypothetical protein DPMN_194073 [Dreissena polymorpha]
MVPGWYIQSGPGTVQTDVICPRLHQSWRLYEASSAVLRPDVREKAKRLQKGVIRYPTYSGLHLALKFL